MPNQSREKGEDMLKEWIKKRLSNPSDLLLPWPNTKGAEELTKGWEGRTAAKILGWKPPHELTVESTTVLGGVCPIYTGDEPELRQRPFQTVGQFEAWLRSWYPRIDQVHDTVGIPPRVVPRVVYVCEDTFFGRKIARWVGLDPDELAQVFRTVHEEQGHSVILRWLRQWGYRGEVEVVYTSDLERELGCALRVWGRVGGFKVKGSTDYLKVVLMYTALWLDVLGIEGRGMIYEPANHTNHTSLPKEVVPWFHNHPYGEHDSVNSRLGIAGFMPFWSTGGATRKLPKELVPNRQSWKGYEVPEEEVAWFAANLLFGQAIVRDKGPESLSADEVRRRINLDLSVYYNGKQSGEGEAL